MKVYKSIHEFNSDKKTIVTIGTFDGVHIGHRRIIERLTQSASVDYESVLLTFFPHPRMVLGGHPDIKLLNTIAEKQILLGQTGLEHLIVHPFDTEFSQLAAEEFVKKILVDVLNIKKIILGHDHRFGRDRSADIDDLTRFGTIYGFEVEQIPVQEINDVSVSSTKIRTALTEGDMLLANKYLGYNYLLSGKVIAGQKLGRTIGFPTANILIEENYKLIPKNGVYFVRCKVGNQFYFGMMNIGNRPTVGGKTQSIEAHLIGFDADIYGEFVFLEVIERLRDERKFDSVDQLKAQLIADLQTTLSLIDAL